MATAKKGFQLPSFPMDVKSSEFDSKFVWGVATSSYQIEGAAFEGGRHPSIWDTFCLQYPDAIHNGDNGNDGTKAYFKTKEDVQMIKKLGLKAYRFSLSWSRILPGGKLSMGINQEGVDYYNNLINELILNDIVPYVTLWHWETPTFLEQEYLGFLSEKIIEDFVNYAEFCFWEFGDRVKHWITLNEPWSYAVGGYGWGTFAPGRGGSSTVTQLSLASGSNFASSEFGGTRSFENNGAGNAATEPYIVGHNLLLCHATAVKLYRDVFKGSQGGDIGITLNAIFYEPLNPKSPIDVAAALRAIDFIFGWFMEPCFRGKYPDTMIENVGDRLPKFDEKQVALVTGSYDFLGLNYYSSQYATEAAPTDVISYMTDSKVHEQPENLDGELIGPKGEGTTWFYSYPPGFYKILMLTKDIYGSPKIFITENGWPDENNNDLKIEEARVDPKRVEYFNGHLQKLRDAIRDGVDVVGYFAWSLMDNFEWADGYNVRFGLFYVDYKHGKYTRYPKKSALWFMDFLKDSKI